MRPPLWILAAALCALLTVGCGSTTPPPVHDAPPVTTPPESPVVAGAVLPDSKKVEDVVVHIDEAPVAVSLWLSDKKLAVEAETGQVMELVNPFGKYATATLDVLVSDAGEHLLVTVRSAFKPHGWVLVPEQRGFRIALDIQADYDISAIDGAVRARSRHYEVAGGFWLLSQYYRPTSKTGPYAFVASEGKPATADLSKGKTGVTLAIAGLPEIEEYGTRLHEHGLGLVFRVDESPSWFVVAVGEDHPEKVTVTRWYVVRKADGMVLEWDIGKGSPPHE